MDADRDTARQRRLQDPARSAVRGHPGSADVQLFTVPTNLSGPITPGTPLTVTTTAPGQNATYTFTGTINSG